MTTHPEAALKTAKLAWITGASSGIGRACALELVQRGWRVAVSARNAEVLGEMVAAGEGHIHAYVCDVTDAAAVADTIAAVEQDLGPIDLAFLNAGISIHNQAPELNLDAMTRIINTNVLGIFNALVPLIAGMGKRRSGQIALCGSVAGYGGLPYATAYSASKAAVINAAVSLAIECAPLGIKVQCVNPGFVDTPMTAKNDFVMPFRLSPVQAGQRIVDGFQSGAFEITFPRRLSWPLKLLNLLPYGVYIWGLRRAIWLAGFIKGSRV